jgi:hypothetical protein
MYWLQVIVMGWYRTKRPLHCDLIRIYCAPHLSSNHSLFIHQNYLL